MIAEVINVPVLPEQDLAPAYNIPEVTTKGGSSFDIDYYKSHYVPTREIIELKKANDD